MNKFLTIIILSVIIATGIMLIVYKFSNKKLLRIAEHLYSDGKSDGSVAFGKQMIFPKQDILLLSYNSSAKDSDFFRVLIDGEPWKINNNNKYDLVITTKKESKTNSLKTIFVPFFSQCFSQMERYVPQDLLKPRSGQRKTLFCAYMYSNCNKKYEGVKLRESFFDVVSKYKPVDALGKCKSKSSHSESTRSKKTFLDDAVEKYRPYKFVIAVENELNIDGYVTEKIVLPLLAGCVPIYIGAPDIKDYFQGGFVDMRKYKNPNLCVSAIEKLDKNQEEYDLLRSQLCIKLDVFQKYFMWKLSPEMFYNQWQG